MNRESTMEVGTVASRLTDGSKVYAVQIVQGDLVIKLHCVTAKDADLLADEIEKVVVFIE